ncbi:MAG: restriction endonuclease subunit S, partial [Spartobacteria bacterium]|nr:restriction endonuclease subunit S [Spartobacteria bacterium]
FTRGLRGEKIKMTEIGEIPKSWDVVPISEVREFLQYGTSKRCTLEAKGIPVLRIPNVIGGKINTKELKFANILTSECERLKLVAGDLLFVRTNGQKQNVGRTAVYRSTPCSALFASYLIRARLKQDIMLPDFLQIYTEADQGRSQLSGRATPASDGKFNINTKTINSVLVPVPSLTEQGNIIGHISIISNRQDHHEKKNVTLQNLFKTTLNKLMTGDIHVDDLDIDVTQVEK